MYHLHVSDKLVNAFYKNFDKAIELAEKKYFLKGKEWAEGFCEQELFLDGKEELINFLKFEVKTPDKEHLKSQEIEGFILDFIQNNCAEIFHKIKNSTIYTFDENYSTSGGAFSGWNQFIKLTPSHCKANSIGFKIEYRNKKLNLILSCVEKYDT